MSFQMQADGQFPDDADGSQEAAFAAQVQALFATLTTVQLNNFSMNISQHVTVIPLDPVTRLPETQANIPAVSAPEQAGLTP